ncbi:TolC family protein [Lentimicrobium sp. S6]|uniref:TolC family protein n=2 Tax=unclassified Lentimicrobium TaxID=2677434 RepID=UPI001553AF7D|nr:TolC family protein [Lentimicrobium sp. L6]NPD47168.1 TolC family protein [Lentimicrobium sp. S6]
MMIKRLFPQIIAITFSFLVLGLGTVLAQKTWTLEECILYALENNIQIKQSRLQTQTAEINLLQSKLDFAPSVNANASLGNNWGRNQGQSGLYIDRSTLSNSFGLNGSLELFGGMKKWNTLQKSELDLKASNYVSEEMENDISLGLTGAYLNIIYSHELLNVAEQQVEVTRQQIERTNNLVEAGTLPRGDLLEIQAQGAQEETNLITAQNNLSLAYLDLKQFLDLPSETDLEIDFPKIELSQELQIIPSDQIYANAVDIMPEIKGGEVNLQSAERSVKIAQGSLYPSLSLNGGISTNYYSSAQKLAYDDAGNPVLDSNLDPVWEDIPYSDQLDLNTGEYLTLNLNIPIFNGYAVKSNVKRAKVQTVDQSFRLQLRKNELRKNIEQKYHDAIAAYKTYNASKFSVESLSEAFNYTEEKFNVGMVNSVDYSLAKIKLTQAQSQYLQAKYDYIFKTKILDFYMGIPLTL